MTKPFIFAVVPEKELCDAIDASLQNAYTLSFAPSMGQAIKKFEASQPDLILCHQSLLEGQQEKVLAALKHSAPEAIILVIGPSRPIEMQITALKHGARGYFDIALPFEKLHTAVHDVLHGEVWVERHVISGLIEELVHVPDLTPEQQSAVESLSRKEYEVAKLVSHGATNKMIANKMAITERTVKAHLTAIFHKMGIPDRLSLAIFFRDLR